MSVTLQARTICTYNLRGQCRFGNRCRNIHEKPEEPHKIINYVSRNFFVPQSTHHNENNTNPSQKDGACALSPKKKIVNRDNENKVSSDSGPSTSSVQKSLSNLRISEKEEKTCGICFDIVRKKTNPLEQNFGILPNCNHCFCFSCISKWRQSKEFDFEVSKACPECRVASEFVYRTRYWMEEKEEKDAYIGKQKQRMKQTDCRYFKKGNGQCPFGNTCMFLHALPNGQVLDVGPPKPRRRSPGTSAADDLVHQIVFWLNDEDVDLETDIDEDFDLDLDDPCIAFQYYDRDDVRRYVAWERLIRGDIDDGSDSEMNFFY